MEKKSLGNKSAGWLDPTDIPGLDDTAKTVHFLKFGHFFLSENISILLLKIGILSNLEGQKRRSSTPEPEFVAQEFKGSTYVKYVDSVYLNQPPNFRNGL